MNILVTKFPHNSQMGGGEVHTLQLFSELKQRGHDFYLVSSCEVLNKEFENRDWKFTNFWAGREPVSIKGIILFTITAPIVFFRLFYVLIKYRIKYKTDKLYCMSMTEKLLITFPAKLLGYSVFWIEHLRIERWLKLNPYRFLYVLNSFFATTIAVSKSVKKQLLDLGLNDKKVKVIYNGVDIEKFKPHLVPELVEGIPPNKLTIGTVCRLSPEKGVDYLIKSFSKSLEKNSELELKIVGEGPEKESLEELSKELGITDKVKFLGWQDNIPEFLNTLDIFALTPTRRESFGISAAEASACELPVIATNISGLKEVVKDQSTGFVVESKNIDKISRAILELANSRDKRIKFGKAGRERVKANFTSEKMIDNFERAFRKH